MKAIDFNLAKDLRFDTQNGIVSFRTSRYVIFDANAIGLLRQSLIETLGWNRARDILLKFGYQHGYADFIQMRLNYTFDDDMELLAAGPVIHTWEGLVQAQPTDIRFNHESGDFFFTGIWRNSFEAQQHLAFNPVHHSPVCWSLMGYASGWCSAFFGQLILCIEPVCVGKGDDHCEWKLQPVEAWGDEAKPYLSALSDFVQQGNMAEKVMKFYKYVGEEKGLQGKFDLASLTKSPIMRASTIPDNEENLRLFRDAVQKITGKPAPKV